MAPTEISNRSSIPLADAKSALSRTKAYGAFSVKSYNQPRREQRQMVIQAARDPI